MRRRPGSRPSFSPRLSCSCRIPAASGAGLEAGSGYRIRAVPLLEQVVGHVRLPLLMLLGATALLLLTACANVASLLLTRAATRRREMSIRAALGADRSRLLGLSMLESLMMASVAGVAGVLLAEVGVRALLSTAPPELPRLADIHVDGQVLAFAAFVCLGSSLLFGLGPAWRASSVPPTDALREGATAVRARSLWKGGSRYLVIVQVALSLVLICGAGLLIRSFLELRAVDPGFRSEGVLSFRLSLTGERYQSARTGACSSRASSNRSGASRRGAGGGYLDAPADPWLRLDRLLRRGVRCDRRAGPHRRGRAHRVARLLRGDEHPVARRAGLRASRRRRAARRHRPTSRLPAASGVSRSRSASGSDAIPKTTRRSSVSSATSSTTGWARSLT